jgi:dipeptidase E
LFFPHASSDPDNYSEVMQTALGRLGVDVVPAHREGVLAHELERAEAIFVGGGNTFRLLKSFEESGLLGAVRTRVREGVAYLGVSAGTNLACPTIRTTNDMPIVSLNHW